MMIKKINVITEKKNFVQMITSNYGTTYSNPHYFRLEECC